MATLTTKEIEKIVEDRINKKVEYVGIIVNEDLVRVRPRLFGFWKLDNNKNIKGFIIVEEADIVAVLKEQKEKEIILKQDKLI
jgi:hypothetical protein